MFSDQPISSDSPNPTTHARRKVFFGALSFVMGVSALVTATVVSGSGRAPVDLMSVVPSTAPKPAAASTPQQLQHPNPAPAPPVSPAAEQTVAGKLLELPQVSISPASLPPRVTFDGKPLKKARSVEMLVTAYSPDPRSCGKWADGITASGYSVWTNAMHLVAADTNVLAFGSIISVPGYDSGKPVPVLDRGGKIKGNHIDVLFPTHEEAMAWGKKRLTVTVWDYAE